MSAFLDLLDWRRRTAELFAELRRRPPDAASATWFRAEKDRLFKYHPQSPLPAEQRTNFEGLPYWEYDPAARVNATLELTAAEAAEVPHSAGNPSGEPADMTFDRIGWLSFTLAGTPCRLGAYWLRGYAGGLFVPVRDLTSGTETYGAGRYLLDTIKGADLGAAPDGSLVLDFNFAFHPSCAYDPRWLCPLAPAENRLTVAVRAGERLA